MVRVKGGGDATRRIFHTCTIVYDFAVARLFTCIIHNRTRMMLQWRGYSHFVPSQNGPPSHRARRPRMRNTCTHRHPPHCSQKQVLSLIVFLTVPKKQVFLFFRPCLRPMSRQVVRSKAAINAVRTRYMSTHESQYFYRLTFWPLMIILSI